MAGIDNVSYKGIAEPLSYADSAQENLPSDFSSLCIRFVTEEDSLVQQYYIPYGSDFPATSSRRSVPCRPVRPAGRMWT